MLKNNKINPTAHKIPVKIVGVTGHTRSGKAIMLSTISSFVNFEKVCMNPIVEEAGCLNFIKKLDNSSAKYLMRRSILMKMYYLSIAREINYRKNDVTSIFSYKNSKVYLKRSKLNEGDDTLKKFINSKPVIPLMIHDGLLFGKLLFQAFPDIKIIEMIKNPIEIAYSWIAKKYEGGFENNLRTSTMNLGFLNKKTPYYVFQDEKKYLCLNKFDKVIFALNKLEKFKKNQLSKLNSKEKKNILVINHLNFVTKTDYTLKKIKFFLGKKSTKFTKKILKKNSCPRNYNFKELENKKIFLKSKLSKDYYNLLLKLESNFLKKK